MKKTYLEKEKEVLMKLRNGKLCKELALVSESIDEQKIGDIEIKSGKIAVCDPLILFDNGAYTEKIDDGNYPVYVYYHQMLQDNRIAFAEVRFSEEMPIEFCIAHTIDQDITKIADDEYFGFSSESGFGSFMDYEVCKKIAERIKETRKPDSSVKKAINDMYESGGMSFNLSYEDGSDISIFSTGFGDGLYPSFFGYNENKKVVCLITDCQTVDVFKD